MERHSGVHRSFEKKLNNWIRIVVSIKSYHDNRFETPFGMYRDDCRAYGRVHSTVFLDGQQRVLPQILLQRGRGEATNSTQIFGALSSRLSQDDPKCAQQQRAVRLVRNVRSTNLAAKSNIYHVRQRNHSLGVYRPMRLPMRLVLGVVRNHQLQQRALVQTIRCLRTVYDCAVASVRVVMNCSDRYPRSIDRRSLWNSETKTPSRLCR